MRIARYQNGNAWVEMYDDGTRIIETHGDEPFDFEYPLNNDITITHKCDGGCPFCYLGCTPDGKHADILSAKFLETVLPGTEMAINLNDLSHPQLEEFMHKMRERGVFLNGTVNQIHFMKHRQTLKRMCDERLLWGLGVSLRSADEEFVKAVSEFPNAVVHVINGILKAEDLEAMRDKGLKMLILGYKDLNRGADYHLENEATVRMRQKYLYGVLPTLSSHFKVISFDNLAIEQLNVRRLLTQEQWDEFYQGDEGTATFAIDLVDGTFGRNSMATGDDVYPIMDDIRDMFTVIKRESKHD